MAPEEGHLSRDAISEAYSRFGELTDDISSIVAWEKPESVGLPQHYTPQSEEVRALLEANRENPDALGHEINRLVNEVRLEITLFTADYIRQTQAAEGYVDHVILELQTNLLIAIKAFYEHYFKGAEQFKAQENIGKRLIAITTAPAKKPAASGGSPWDE
jgi:hypothetical protein